MAIVNAKCTECGANITVDSKEKAVTCSECKVPILTKEAIKLYKKSLPPSEAKKKFLHFLKWAGLTFLFILKCIGYLIYVFTFMWLFFDIVDRKK